MSEIYKMTVDLNVLDHLGINLYSNIAAVLTEAVANAWDADAETVDIMIDPKAEWIEIVDDGVGMSIDDMNEKYLRVGYRRRDEDTEHGKFTAKGRQVMGRKGLGKLSLFSIARLIDVQAARDEQAHGLRMSVDGIHESVENKEPYYRPEPLPAEEVTVAKGTKIVLRDIKRQRLGRGAAALRKRLARRFSVIGELYDFRITIDGKPVATDDRGDLPMAQPIPLDLRRVGAGCVVDPGGDGAGTAAQSLRPLARGLERGRLDRDSASAQATGQRRRR